MADSEGHPTITPDDRPVVARRKRSTSDGPNHRSRINPRASKSGCHSVSTLPATPKRSKKRVRFSDPRPETELESASSGLTPFVRRTALSITPPLASHDSTPASLWNRGDYSIPISGTVQFEPLRQMLDSRLKRRLRRRGLSEEANNIESGNRREVRRLRTEVERLKSELEAKCAEIQSIRDMEELGDQDESGDAIAELTARVQELEQQVAELKAELYQKEVESEGVGDADSVVEDGGRETTNDDLQEAQGHDDVISVPTRLDTSFPSPPPSMPNTPCKHSSSGNTRVTRSIPIPDPSNEVLNNQLQLELELRRESWLANHTPEIAQSSPVRLRKEKVGRETRVAGLRERRQGTRWMSTLVPFFSPNASGE